MRLIPLLLAAGALATVAGCDRSKVEKSSAPAPAPAATGLPPIQGTVLEVLPAPPYSYLRVKAAQGDTEVVGNLEGLFKLAGSCMGPLTRWFSTAMAM